MRKALCIAMIGFLFVLGLSLNVNAKDKNLEKYRYSEFKHIKHFGRIMVNLIGSAESLELNRKDLKNYFLLKYKNNFSEVEYKPSILNESVNKSKFDKKNVGYIHFYIWTEGKNYPIAYHTKLEVGSIESGIIYYVSKLGVSSKDNIKNKVEDAITDLIEDCAITFFKARGEL